MLTPELKAAVEAVLFATEKPLTLSEIAQAFEAGGAVGEIEEALEALQRDYDVPERGFRLTQIAGGWQIVSDPRFAPNLRRFFQAREKKKLTAAGMETLAVIAYRQPVTRADIEFVRGVSVDGAIRTLLERRMIKIAGKKEVPGRPMLYGTTQEFLDHFGLKSLSDLPPLSEFSIKDLDPNLVPPELKDGIRKTEDGVQNTEDGIQNTEDGGQAESIPRSGAGLPGGSNE